MLCIAQFCKKFSAEFYYLQTDPQELQTSKLLRGRILLIKCKESPSITVVDLPGVMPCSSVTIQNQNEFSKTDEAISLQITERALKNAYIENAIIILCSRHHLLQGCGHALRTRKAFISAPILGGITKSDLSKAALARLSEFFQIL